MAGKSHAPALDKMKIVGASELEMLNGKGGHRYGGSPTGGTVLILRTLARM